MLKPILDNVVIKRAKPEDRSKGGIVLPDTAQQKSLQGEVLAVGPGRFNDQNEMVMMPFDVRVGVVAVIAARHRGTEVTIGGETYLVVPVSDVLGTIE
jgi:chaperonin GroES